MALRLLLEAHFDKAIVTTLVRHGIDAEHLAVWRGGLLLQAADRELLLAAHEEGRALVTFDVSTIPEELERLFLEGRAHAGVIFVSQRTFQATDIAGIAQALASLATRLPTLTDGFDWLQRVT